MKKSRIALAFVAGASLIFAACGGDDGGSVSTEAPVTSEAPSDSEAPSTWHQPKNSQHQTSASLLTPSKSALPYQTLKRSVPWVSRFPTR
jgi:ABC-type glycerol-3-phosphate transport system substrate-binding protein